MNENMMTVAYKNDTAIQANIEGSIVKILAYFSIFHYPLSRTEITRYLPPGSRIDDFDDALEQLVDDAVIFRIAEFYSLNNDSAWVKRRRDGNLRAEYLLTKAKKIGRFLAKFPYVRGVCISGSLSKMYADEKADIDFFIITKADRLWIARTCMHLFKKLTFLAGRQHYYCMNYYIDEKALTLEDENIYTAMETVTLMPVSGEAVSNFFAANEWVGKWFADHPDGQESKKIGTGNTWVKSIAEWMMNNKAGSRLDKYLQKLTTNRWRKKKQAGMRNEEGKEMDLLTGRHFAKSNPGMFREKILALYEDKINDLIRRHPGYF